MTTGTRNYQSIGEVLVAVKTEFPDITISKIRFLEHEGLIEPERTPSGYRKFYEPDVERLRSILRMQRDEYLPLKVIKERLLRGDAGTSNGKGDAKGGGSSTGTATVNSGTRTADDGDAQPDEGLPDAPAGLQMSLEEMASATGIDRERIKELESFGIICLHGPDGSRYFDGDDYVTLSVVKDFFAFGGIEPRHLKMYKNSTEREASLFEAIVAPMLRQKNPDARRAAVRTLQDMSTTSRRLKQALLRAALRPQLGGPKA